MYRQEATTHGQPDGTTRRRLLFATAAAIGITSAFQLARPRAASGPSEANAAPPTPTATPLAADLAPSGTAAAIPEADVQAVQPFDHPVGPGMSGDKVRRLQRRLRELGFDPGPADGYIGPGTERAIWAFEKFILNTEPPEVTGIVTPEMWARMNDPISIRPRRASRGVHLEVILPKQVAVLYQDNLPILITHVSTGSGEQWCGVVTVDRDDGSTGEEGICGVATTPGGVFHFERRIEGWRNSKLGRLYNPVYFNYGIAVHGATSVPKRPASRGCVRIPMHIAEYFPSLVNDGDLVYVFDGVKQPEDYGAQLPVFDYPDPNYVPRTTAG
jgi:peptidoglycan hydrolase-like protein with peptidoglycan-binding domain